MPLPQETQRLHSLYKLVMAGIIGGLKNVYFGHVDQSGSSLLYDQVYYLSFPGNGRSWILKRRLFIGLCCRIFSAVYASK